MLLIVYIFISIMYGSSNTALQNDHFEGESSLTDVQNPKLQRDEEPNRQTRFNSNSKFYRMSTKFFPNIDKGNNFIYSKALRSLRDKDHLPENFKKNKISSRIKKRRSKNARRNSKTSDRTALDDTENIINLFNKSGPPLEYVKKTFQISVDSKEDSPELFRTKNLEKWRKKNLSHRTRMKNKDHSFEKSSKNFLKRLLKNKNRSMRKSKKRSIGLQSRKSALPMETKFFHPNSECQPLESFHLFQDVKFGKLFDPDLYKKCLLLRKTNTVELLIKNKGDATKFFEDALHGDLFSVFKVMDRLPVTPLYESEIPGEHINLSDNIQKPSKIWKNSDLLNIDAEEDKFLPIDRNKLPVFESLTKEAIPSNKDKSITDMYMFPNNIFDQNNFAHKGLQIGNKIDGNTPIDEILQRQSFNKNFPSIYQGNSPIVKEHQNYVQIENKETLTKIISPINDTTTKELFEANIKRLKPTTVPQMENLFASDTPKYMKPPKIQNLGSGINNGPIPAPSGFARTEFPNIPTKEGQVLKEVTSSLYSPSHTTFTKTESLEFENKVKQADYQLFTEKTFNILPIQVHTSSVKLKPFETTTKGSEAKQLVSQSETSPTFTVNAKDIHIVITEPFHTEMIPGTVAPNILKGNTESDYNVNNPPIDLIPKEEIPETDPKLLKMHIRHSHLTKEPEIRYRRQGFHHQ
ncbi:hypothetical protein AVEN_229671-1 [Araneus ventricosus]|uniref:Uncharacterized protein n=1 Tax=Araneus ventricosus TaxID=182803 RepID=A0A4Y2LEE5_ARAVE|nr:hypothetical protein AVEN_229671-1 [Araneus ventricosus]